MMQPAAGCDGSLCYGDGENLIVGFGNDVVSLSSPFVRQISVNQPAYTYSVAGGVSRRMPGLMEVEVELVARCAAWHQGASVPDLKAIAEKLTISELFEVIEKKLAERAKGISQGIVTA